jgi:hypothetical protein
MVLLAIQWGGINYAWNSATIIGLFCGSFVNIILFILWERRKREDAMIPLSIISRQTVAFACASAFFQMGDQLLQSYYLPIWFQVVQGVDPTVSGVRTLPMMISQMIAAVAAGVLGRPPHLSNLLC